jgi:hypothetical protein
MHARMMFFFGCQMVHGLDIKAVLYKLLIKYSKRRAYVYGR